MEDTDTSAAVQVLLRDLTEADLPTLFEQQLDPDANYMAAFTGRDPADRAAFDAHWKRIMTDATVRIRAVTIAGRVAGSILSYVDSGHTEIGYWFGREFWGRGIASRALALFVAETPVRPLNARAAKDNLASLRVLEKCGFRVTGQSSGFAKARGKDTEEFILELA